MPVQTDTETAIATKLAKLLPLLGSDSPGEVVATAGAIGRVLGSSGRDWHDLAERLFPDVARERVTSPESHPGRQRQASGCPTWLRLSHAQRLAWFDVVWCKVRLPDDQARHLERFEGAYRGQHAGVTRANVSLFNKVVNVAWTLGARA